MANPMATTLLHRVIPALGVALAVGLLGFAAVGFAKASPDAPADVPEHFRIAERHAGDSIALTTRFDSIDANGGRTLQYQGASSYVWGPEVPWLDGLDGTWHAAHIQQPHPQVLETGTSGAALAVSAGLVTETGTGRTLGTAFDASLDWHFSYSPAPVLTSSTEIHSIVAGTQWSPQAACGLDQAVRAGVDLTSSFALADSCLSGNDQPIPFTIARADLDGIPTVRFTADVKAGRISIDYNEGIPEALRIEGIGETPSGPFVATQTLTGFTPGAVPWDTALSLPPPVDLRPIVLAPRKPWGADETGMAVAFPASAAWHHALDDPTFHDFRDFMAKHPQAMARTASYSEMVYGNQTIKGWGFIVADDGAEFSLGSSQQTGPLGAVATDILGVPPVPAAGPPSYNAAGTVDPIFLCPPNRAAQLPTAASVAARWQAMTGSAKPANGWTLSCDDQGGQVSAGWQGQQAEAMRVQDIVQGNQRKESDFSSALNVAANGSILSLQTQHTSDGQSNQLLGSDPPGPIAASAASPGPPARELRAAGILWSAPAGPVATGATLASILAGLLYWIWPALKGSGLGLFSRIQGPDLLEHPVRRSIMDAVGAHPGIHYLALVRLVGGGKGAVEHHLQKMTAAGLLVAHRGIGFTCYFPAHTDRRLTAAAGVLKADGARRILVLATIRPGATSSELASATGLDGSTVSYHVHRLAEVGLVAATRHGRTLRVAATPLAAGMAVGSP